MGLRILQSREIWWPIRVALPGDGGSAQNEEGDVRVRFPIRSDDLARLSTLPREQMLDAVAAFISGWRGPLFTDESGAIAEFSADALVAALAIPAVNGAVQVALLEIANGRAARKNSPTGAAGS